MRVIFILMLSFKTLRGFNRPHLYKSISSSRLAVKDSNNDEPKSISQPAISWYPGHIAKAERELSEYLKKVDVVVEVRDARIPLATTHPLVPEWVGSRPLIVAIARIDLISKKALSDWREYYTLNPAHPNRPDAKVYFVDGKLGAGVLTLKKQALKASTAINERRLRRGIQPRAVRAAVIGFPNVGKSALINRLLGRRMAKSKNLPGVTRSLQWVRLGGNNLEGLQSQEDAIELLDSPGIIPARQLDQQNALYLAMCNDIGEASYDRVVVAAHLCDRLNLVHRAAPGYIDMRLLRDRYQLDFHTMTGEEIVFEVAERTYKGNMISAADRLLGDFRRGLMGRVSLEVPAVQRVGGGEGRDSAGDKRHQYGTIDEMEEDEELRREARAEPGTGYRRAAAPAGTDPDPRTPGTETETETVRNKERPNLDIGRGQYDGW